MPPPRIVVQGATFAITRRTTLRKAFLAPWHPLVEQCWLYALADAQRIHGFAVHHGVRVVSHQHLSVTLADAVLGKVLHHFHRDVSCALQVLLARERYDTPRNLFDGREPHSMRLLDAAAQASHLTYEYLNPIAAGLVARPEHMPGTVLDFGHWKSGGILVNRPDVYFSRERPEQLHLELTPPPLLMRAFNGDLDALVHHMRRLADDGVRVLRDARRGRPPLGAQRLVRMHPWMEPKTLAEPGGRRVPSFKLGARGLGGRTIERTAAAEVRAFRAAHKSCRAQWRNGDRSVVFPHGTYGMRLHHNVTVGDPPADAIVAQPGPSMADVVRELDTQNDTATEERALDRRNLLEETRDAWLDEANDIAQLEELDFVTTTNPAGDNSNGTVDPQARSEPRVRHRFDRDVGRGDERHPRRIISKRDRRRGRRPKNTDPPV